MGRAEASKDEVLKRGDGHWPPLPGAREGPWPPPPRQEDLIPGLTDLLRTRLSQAIDSSGKTWAQQLIDVWLGEALSGNLRAIQEIVERIDGAAARSPAPSESGPSLMDEQTASRILESLCGPDDDLPED